jgi:phosphopantetheinyl transferase (holo-ACP synthase)
MTVYQPSCCHWKKAPAELFVLKWVYYSVLAELFALRESASQAVCAEMCVLQCTSQDVFTERKHQPSCLHWNEFTTVFQPSCFHWNKAPAELRAVCTEMTLRQWTSRAVCTERKRQLSCFHWDEFTTVNQPSCLHWKKAPAELFALRWLYYSEPAELFALKERVSWAVFTEMSFLQWTSQAVCTDRKRQPSCLLWDEFRTVYQPSCLHWKKAPAELFALRWV